MTQRIEFCENFQKIRENLHFVLVEPEYPGNIGATARALKTCGFEKLVLVNPFDITHPEVEWMAHQSMDIIHHAKVVATFDEAIADMNLIAATTMRHRQYNFPFLSPLEISERLQTVALTHPVAIVFGRESNGLANDELFRCHLHTTIPTATQYPALNLSQSVMIYAHTFFINQNVNESVAVYDLAAHDEIEHYYRHLGRAVAAVGFQPRDTMDNFISRLRRLLGRAQPERRDVRMLHKLVGIFEDYIAELEKHVEPETLKKFKDEFRQF